MPTFENLESLSSVRDKLNDAILLAESTAVDLAVEKGQAQLAASQAQGYATVSQEAAALAADWAESSVSPDGTSSKSSKTWASESATSAANSAASATASAGSATSAAASSAAAGAASARLVVSTFAELATTYNYTGTGGRRLVAAGDIITVLSIDTTYTVLASAASGADLDYTGSGGVKLTINHPARTNPMARGAAGDGTTNDKTVIDALNVAGTTVNLAGRTYAYTGDFAPVANFANGVVVSSTLGTFDYRVGEITQATTITVGAAGTIKTLRAAFDWLQSGVHVKDSLTLSVTGNHSLVDYTFAHPDSARITVIGPALSGAIPSKATLIGDRAIDEALILSRFGAVIDVGGTGDVITGGGLRLPFGMGFFERVAITSNTRYSLDVGYNQSAANMRPSPRLGLADVAIVGGVWGMITFGTAVRVRAGTTLLLAYQNTGTQPGGGADFVRSDVVNEGSIRVFSAGQSSKYGINATRSTVLTNAGTNPNLGLDVKGPFLYGVHAQAGSYIECNGLVTDGVTSAGTAQPGSMIRCSGYSVSNNDPATTSSLTGASQTGFTGNAVSAASAAIFFAGDNAVVELNGGSITNCINTTGFQAVGGKIIQGPTAVTITDCGFPASGGALARFSYSRGNHFAANVVSPKAGTTSQVLCQWQSTVALGTNSGLTFSPAIGTTTNGNLITNAA